MKILTYALPIFLNKGEVYEYTNEYIYSLLKAKKNIPITFLKEKKIKSKLCNLPITNLEFCTNKNMIPVRNFIKENNINIYHCLNNGFSLFPCNKLKKVCTIHTTLPLSEKNLIDKQYINKYENKLESVLDIAHKIIVPFNYMKNDLLRYYNIDDDMISVISPIISPLFTEINSVASKIYIKSKFKIDFEYIIYIGELNNRNNLIETLDIFYIIHMNNRNLKLILSLTYLNKYEKIYLNLLSYIEQLNIEDNVIIINNISQLDKAHLINNALCFVYLNPYNELNLTLLQCLSLNTKILCHPSESNLESLENYPIYYTDSLDFNEILSTDFYFDEFEKEFIVSKYDYIDNSEMLYDLYLSLF